ncbi:GNAT family N-acetyltransferase [Lentzea tibetensis]|uniref:GNAT family N-acetyltransferase n=1 Tax=Lentzea tibetensis TaxID=2591470 RepID=A0A563EGI3_9PSEU|nr:GNAT family N-acetyltransferase [Lentzea tibetensis]TWP45446.1 GNAT family N-acetyltransferase [Lentzea tibetensis]
MKLIAELQQVYVVRYGDVDATPVDPAQFAAPEGYFAIGYSDGVPVACGGWRYHSAMGGAEIKRMYVIDRLRGRGLSRQVLAHLESTARAAGHRRMVLETGQAQPEAIGLYVSSGYTEIEKYGVYKDEPESVCYAKDL